MEIYDFFYKGKREEVPDPETGRRKSFIDKRLLLGFGASDNNGGRESPTPSHVKRQVTRPHKREREHSSKLKVTGKALEEFYESYK